MDVAVEPTYYPQFEPSTLGLLSDPCITQSHNTRLPLLGLSPESLQHQPRASEALWNANLL
jgi:hypothetical protein